MTSAEQIIEHFGMKPLVDEGGYYVETYRCKQQLLQGNTAKGYDGPRSFGTAIFYLLTSETFSAIHRLKSDEVFHFYLGDPVTMLQLHPDGSGEVVTLGHDIAGGQQVQVTVPAGTWQGSVLEPGGRFALMGTTVTPGFEQQDFELGRREKLLEQYPTYGELVMRLTNVPPMKPTHCSKIS